jgi:predicted enzyme related to lactoylglutathione lyase
VGTLDCRRAGRRVDAAFKKALGAGAKEMLAGHDFPGGRFAIVQDPQGAVPGLHKGAAR